MLDTADTDRMLAYNVRTLAEEGKLTTSEVANVESKLRQPIDEWLMDINTKLRLTKGALQKTNKKLRDFYKKLKDDSKEK